MQGDQSALFDMANYFDSKKEVTEFLGHHIIKTNESAVAKRIVQENCIFTDSEITISNNTTRNEFLTFLNANKNKIIFSKLADAFLITPLEVRTSKAEFREIAEIRKTELRAKYADLLTKEWVWKADIHTLIQNRNSKALVSIASELYKIRYRFDSYPFNESEYIELLQILLESEIAVENEKKELTWHIDKAFYPDASLNLLIYFAGNYSHFKWDEKSSTFINDKVQVKAIEKEEALFQLLNSQNDSIALEAFTQLTRCRPAKVSQLADEYERINFDKNGAIPTFPYRFLKQLVLLTDYCKKNTIDFEGSERLKSTIDRLDLDLSFAERRKLEDSLIHHLPLEEITAFEYWAAIKEQSWGTTYSAGRILDIFYSRHWNEILHTERDLKLFLKKAYLFDQLGIIGICNNYLKKFTNMQQIGIDRLDLVQTDDNDIKNQIEKAKLYCNQPLKVPNDTMKINAANRDYNITNVAEKIRAIKAIRKQEKLEDKLVKLLSQINYAQIGEALLEIEDIQFKENSWKKYTFMERDWGFFLEDNFDTLPARTAFLKLYNTLSEFELYSYYLEKAGIDYKNKDNSLNYDKIVDILKYNVVVAFVGGGGGKRDNEVYSLIKILELTHKTTLGYPKKLCNSNGIYGCDSQDRANEWIQFLVTRNLLKEQHNEPVSFHYE
ncbi:hypothetical protein QNI16_31365 [Cytophagaceae bacterium YF14B1]|uniref:Uncharacterized protein n=1 Tax=Xanthocytophaga flava TaxID=3048013 RepID=A0AAE3U9F2_9BACT|nr:hypothetical protein [Xanthocytophaga flavus]MDJ1485039.1 hypothetical protein [Xanthocytophaga flavus]